MVNKCMDFSMRLLRPTGFSFAWCGRNERARMCEAAVLRRNPEWVEKGIMDFTRSWKSRRAISICTHASPNSRIESFAKTEKEKKLLAMWRGFRMAVSLLVLPRGIPKDRVEILQEAMRKVFNDPEFRAEFKK